MRKILVLGAALCGILSSCERPKPAALYTVGYIQWLESRTNEEVRRGFFKAVDDAGGRDGVNIRLRVGQARGDISLVQKIAADFVAQRVDVIVAASTPSLQAALMLTRTIPIVFASVANPYLTRAGTSSEEHLPNVTGVASTAPIRQTMSLIRTVLPGARRLGTLWTPSEQNSEYYLDLTRSAAVEFGFEIVDVPVTNPSEVLLAAQVLVNKKVDAMYPISDNTINASFEAIGRVAEENRIPLFGGFLLATQDGACAAMGWDFFDMGYKAGQVVLRIKAGESPARIPFETMADVKLHLNLKSAERQGVTFSPVILKRADEIQSGDNT
jgi:putative ABC transport system substrate-binding protein